MTYFTCNKCGAQIPETATFCPRCGIPVQCPVQQTVQRPVQSPAQLQPAQKPKSNAALYVIIGVLLAACLGLAAWLFLFNDKDNKTDTPTASVSETTVKEATTTLEKELEAETEAVPSQGVYMGLWGQIGDSNDVDFEMNGTTGYYSYRRNGQDSGRRTLKLVSYDKQSGRCIIEAFAQGKSIGRFDGTFSEIDVEDDSGEHHYGQSYGGKFISTNGTVLDFSLYYD